MSKYTEEDLKVELENKEYEYGFYTELDSETFPIGLNEDIVRAISKKKEEPQWMTDWRIEAFRAWEQMTEPEWASRFGFGCYYVQKNISRKRNYFYEYFRGN